MNWRATGLSTKQKVLLLVASFLATLALLEVGIRLLDLSRGYGFFSTHRWHAKKLLPFRSFGFPLYHRNKDGTVEICSRYGETYPLLKPADSFRIVCFGGSTSENKYSYDICRRHYPLELQKLLRRYRSNRKIEVINVAYAAYATPHSLILLELHVLSWQPDLVILSHNINDLISMYWPDFQPDYGHKYGHPYYQPNPLVQLTDRFGHHCQLYLMLRQLLSQARGQKVYPIHRRSYGNHPDPAATAIFRRNLLSFVTLAQANHIQVLLATQPLQPQPEMFALHFRHKPYNKIVTYPLEQEFVAHHRYFNTIIRQVATKSGAWFLDNDALLQGKPQFFIDCVHYTPEGVTQLATAYAHFVSAKLARRK